MKILLLNGPCTPNFSRTGRWAATSRGASFWYPYWLASCCVVLEEAGHECKLIDAPVYGYSLKKVLEEISAFSTDLCVIDTATSSIKYDLETAKAIKNYRSSIKTCLVGPHASACAKELAELDYIDHVIKGEYDYAVRDIAAGLMASIFSCSLIKDLDELPFASKAIFKHLDINKYQLDFCLHPYMTIMTSRGCPHKCTFCLWPQTLTGGKYRERSLDHVFRELNYIALNHREVKEIFFDDDTFTVNRDRVFDFCHYYIVYRYPFPFSINTRADVDYLTLKELKRAGLRCAVVGFESGNQHILDNVKKNITLERMRTFDRHCHELGIQVHGDFVIGLPGETKQTIANTVKFAKDLHLSTFQLSLAVPLPGTEFYNYLDKNDYLTTRDFSDWIDSKGAQRCVIDYPNLSHIAMEKAIPKALKEYYLSPQFLINALKQVVKDPRELRRYLKGGIRFYDYLRRNKS